MLVAPKFLAALVGCALNSQLVRSDTFERTTTQVGMLEAPTAPHDIGPQLAPGQVALQGALEYGATPGPRTTRAGGASGALLATGWARGQATFGVARWLQLGAELEGSPAFLTRAVATDVSNDGWTAPLGRGGLTMRAHWQTGWVAWEPFVEVEGSGVAWYHTDTVVETVTTYGGQGSETATTNRDDEEFKRALYVSARTGMSLAFGAPEKVQFRAGPYVSNAPWLYGSWSDRWGCDYYARGQMDCSRPEHEPQQVSTIFMVGLFGNLSVPLGPIVVNAGGWVDAIPSDEEDALMARPGGTLSLELLLGGRHRD